MDVQLPKEYQKISQHTNTQTVHMTCNENDNDDVAYGSNLYM